MHEMYSDVHSASMRFKTSLNVVSSLKRNVDTGFHTVQSSLSAG